MVLLREERENTESTIFPKARSNDCKPMTVARVVVVSTTLAAPRFRLSRACGWWAQGPATGLGRRNGVASVRLPLGRVAKWQTRWLQVPGFERTWGFKSPLAHQRTPAQLGSFRVRDGCLLPDFYWSSGSNGRRPRCSGRAPLWHCSFMVGLTLGTQALWAFAEDTRPCR